MDILNTFILLLAAFASSLQGLDKQMEQLARPANGHVGAAVLIVETGELAAFHGDEHFPMQSVYKLPIGMAVLEQVDHGTLKLEQKVRVAASDLVPAGLRSPIRDKHPRGEVDLSVRELLRYMLVDSDGTASDVLLRLAGGPERVTKYLRELGVEGIVVATSEQEMARDVSVQYRNWATPAAMTDLLRKLYEGRGLSKQSQVLLLQFMIETGTGPRRLKGLLPAGTVVAHKTGTSGTVNGLTHATNDVGLITLPDGRHLAVAVFVSDAKANEAVRERVIAEIALAAWKWSTQPQH